MTFHFVVGKAIHLHQLSDLLRRRHCISVHNNQKLKIQFLKRTQKKKKVHFHVLPYHGNLRAVEEHEGIAGVAPVTSTVFVSSDSALLFLPVDYFHRTPFPQWSSSQPEPKSMTFLRHRFSPSEMAGKLRHYSWPQQQPSSPAGPAPKPNNL